MMENVIYNELVRRGCQVDVGVVPIVSVAKDGRQELRHHEIDFVVNRAPGKLETAKRLLANGKLMLKEIAKLLAVLP